MDNKFQILLDGLHEKYQQLISMFPVTIGTIPKDCPKGGVYLFTENGNHLYAGRTKRKIKDRLKDHIGTPGQGAFSLRLTCEALGIKATYKKGDSKNLKLSEPQFKEAYESTKNLIRRMEVRYVSEPDPIKQALLEIYVAVVSGAKYNDFDTH